MNHYLQTINEKLRPKINDTYKVLDLFAGCGGLSLGFEAAGFETIGYEIEQMAVNTYNKNLNGHCFVEKLTTDTCYSHSIDIIIGGPPCQPFSVGGQQKGFNDERNGFPVFIKAIQDLKPKLWLFENVRGMLYSNKSYFEKIIDELSNMGYTIDYQLLNAVNFGVPQNRERLFVVGHHNNFNFPNLVPYKVTAGEAISDLMDSHYDESKILTPAMDTYIAKYEKASNCINPRDLYLHKPARTLTCRNIAGSTGDMHRIKLANGSRRRISIREAARLQSFPDWFEFIGSETQQFYQIGNAVPPLLAFQLAESVKNCLMNNEMPEFKTKQYKKIPTVQMSLL